MKDILKAEEELWKLKYFTNAKIIIFKKSRNQNPSRYYYNSINQQILSKQITTNLCLVTS